MRRGTARVPWLLALALLPACGGGAASAPPAAPTPAPAVAPKPPDPSAAWAGHWLYHVEIGGESYAGTMDLTRAPDGSWSGKVVDNSMGELPITSVKVSGTGITVSVVAGENASTVEATLQPDGTAVGKVLANGGEGTFSAKKG